MSDGPTSTEQLVEEYLNLDKVDPLDLQEEARMRKEEIRRQLGDDFSQLISTVYNRKGTGSTPDSKPFIDPDERLL